MSSFSTSTVHKGLPPDKLGSLLGRCGDPGALFNSEREREREGGICGDCRQRGSSIRNPAAPKKHGREVFFAQLCCPPKIQNTTKPAAESSTNYHRPSHQHHWFPGSMQGQKAMPVLKFFFPCSFRLFFRARFRFCGGIWDLAVLSRGNITRFPQPRSIDAFLPT
jgi:hypothetical protein